MHSFAANGKAMIVAITSIVTSIVIVIVTSKDGKLAK